MSYVATRKSYDYRIIIGIVGGDLESLTSVIRKKNICHVEY
jgi:hypothetical protein